MCAKNYTCKNKSNLPQKPEKIEKKENKKQINNTIELEQLENETFFDQPCSKNFSRSHSCCPKNHVTFANENSTLPPSFNLNSAQKSTPKRQANCSSYSPFQFAQSNATSSDVFHTANSSTQIANSPSQTANSHMPFQIANSPSQTVVSIETNCNQSANDTGTIV